MLLSVLPDRHAGSLRKAKKTVSFYLDLHLAFPWVQRNEVFDFTIILYI